MANANNIPPADVATSAAAMRDAHSTEETQRHMYENEPGVGVDRPAQDPEARRLETAD